MKFVKRCNWRKPLKSKKTIAALSIMTVLDFVRRDQYNELAQMKRGAEVNLAERELSCSDPQPDLDNASGGNNG